MRRAGRGQFGFHLFLSKRHGLSQAMPFLSLLLVANLGCTIDSHLLTSHLFGDQGNLVLLAEHATITTQNNLQLTVQGGTAPFQFWVDSEQAQVDGSGHFSATAPGTYDVRVSDASGLYAIKRITVNPALEASVATPYTQMASKKNLLLNGGVPPYAYQLLSGSGNFDPQDASFTPTNQGLNQIQVTDALGNISVVNLQSYQSGDLDLLFNGSGKLEVANRYGHMEPTSSIELSNQKVLISGLTMYGTYESFFVLRLNADKSTLDSSFGTNGVRILHLGPNHNVVNKMQVQPDGKILLFGAQSNGANLDMVVVRLDANGQLDASFGTAGVASVDFGFGDDVAFNGYVQSSGKILVVGSAENGSNLDAALLRLNADGSLDTSFQGSGMNVLDIDNQNEAFANVLFDGVNKFYAIGYTINPITNKDILIARWHEDGSLDSSFNLTGYNTLAASNGDDELLTMGLQTTGHVVVGGKVAASGDRWLLVRFQSDGALDTSFATAGLHKHAPSNFSAVYDLHVLADESIVGFGQTWAPGAIDATLMRWDANGLYLTSFDNDGYALSGRTGTDSFKSGIVLADGSFLGIGNIILLQSGYTPHGLFLAHYTASGSLVPSFGVGGAVEMHHLAQASLLPRNLLMASDNQIYFGAASQSSDYNFALGMFDEAGRASPSFLNGFLTVQDQQHDNLDTGKVIALTPTNKIVQVGDGWGSGTNICRLQRYNMDGTLDLSFNTVGSLALDPVHTKSCIDIKVQSDGKYLILSEQTNLSRDLSLTRLNPDGALDTSFNGMGYRVDDILGVDNGGSSLVLQPDGKILVGGWVAHGSGFLIKRYNADGSDDTTFAAGVSYIQIDFGVGSERVRQLALQSDGKILAVGYGGQSGEHWAVVRLNPNGSLDTSFGSAGVYTYNHSPQSDRVHAVGIDGLGRILLVGRIHNGQDYDVGVQRLTSNGLLDTSFASAGLMILGESEYDETPTSLLIDSKNRAIVSMQKVGDFNLSQSIFFRFLN